ncbi:MAG: GNAT family N-acetyltransferase [Acidiferrobacterales bacterium]
MNNLRVPDRDVITHLVESSERHMWVELMRHVPEQIANDLGIEVQEFGSAVGFAFKALPHWMMNRVLGLGYGQPATVGQVEDIITFYADRELPVGISLVPHVQPPETVEWLQHNGFVLQNVWAKMYRDNSPIETKNIDFEIIELGKADVAEFSHVMCTGFGMPPHSEPVFGVLVDIPGNHVYGVHDGDKLVAVSVLTIVDGVGYLNSMTTLEPWRGRGIQGALMAHHVDEGTRLGCKWFATETGLLPNQVNHSYNNMVRSGFRMAYERPNYVRQ